MFSRAPVLSLLAAVPLAACAGGGGRPAATASVPADWHVVATRADRARLRDWRGAWMQAEAEAARDGHADEIRAAGALLQPDAALAHPTPPPGDYRCRIVKLGARSAGMLSYVAYPPFACRVARDGAMLAFAKLTGSQRPVGLLYPADRQRMVFLGTMVLSDERTAHDYGRDAERDMIGAMERIGPARWRLVLPRPRWESLVDVIELVPALSGDTGE